MPRRIPIPDLSAGEATLGGGLGHYLAHVLRMRAGDGFVAFDPATGREADALTLPSRGASDTVEVRVGALREGVVLARRGLIWVQALTKGNKCDSVVRDATELGATRIIVAASRRSVARLDPTRAAARADRWSRIAQDAARQSGSSTAPGIDAVRSWDEAVACVSDEYERFCLWEEAAEPLGPRLFESLERNAPLAFACGPEGGLDVEEIDRARARGWFIASLGPRLLRTETVAAAVLGAVQIGARAFAP